MDVIHELTEYFRKFPGIGPKQAQRFVYHLLKQDSYVLQKISSAIAGIKKNVRTCASCHRFFMIRQDEKKCPICANKNRSRATLMIVANDSDVESMERAGVYDGQYFVLGGAVPILHKNPEEKVRLNELRALVEASPELREIIIAVNANPEGEHTLNIVRAKIADLAEKLGAKITTLGRGLSTGAEIEYTDSETIKNALRNRF